MGHATNEWPGRARRHMAVISNNVFHDLYLIGGSINRNTKFWKIWTRSHLASFFIVPVFMIRLCTRALNHVILINVKPVLSKASVSTPRLLYHGWRHTRNGLKKWHAIHSDLLIYCFRQIFINWLSNTSFTTLYLKMPWVLQPSHRNISSDKATWIHGSFRSGNNLFCSCITSSKELKNMVRHPYDFYNKYVV